MGFDINEISANSKGGTELMRMGLEERLPVSLLDDFQIIPSRVRNIQEDKIRIYWLHDLPEDPETNHLHDINSRSRFHKLVFCGEWQYTRYRDMLGVPHDDSCIVIDNAVEPFEEVVKSKEEVRLIYFSTPQRGLEILVPVFESLSEKYKDKVNLVLDVYSSFNIYGWEDPPAYKELFERCKLHPRINYHGSQPHHVVRQALKSAHIMAYPSIWMECNSVATIEAMSASVLCVHPNYGGLVDTTAGLTNKYQWTNDRKKHEKVFYSELEHAIQTIHEQNTQQRIKVAKQYADMRFSWDVITKKWISLLEELKEMYPEHKRAPVGPIFSYRVN